MLAVVYRRDLDRPTLDRIELVNEQCGSLLSSLAKGELILLVLVQERIWLPVDELLLNASRIAAIDPALQDARYEELRLTILVLNPTLPRVQFRRVVAAV